MVKSFETPLVLILAVGYEVEVMKWLQRVCFFITQPVLCIAVVFPSPVLSSGVNVSWCLISVQVWMGSVTFIWGPTVSLMLLYKGPTSVCPTECFRFTEERNVWKSLDNTKALANIDE